MRAVHLAGWGTENIHVREVADPGPAAGEARAAYEEFAAGPYRARIVLTF
jgi:hypothetical protein